MQEIYLSVDAEREEFNISQAVFNAPMPKADLVVIEPMERSGDARLVIGSAGRNLSWGAIVGIVVGVLVLVGVLGGVGWMWRKKKNGKGDGGRVVDADMTEEGPTMDVKNWVSELGTSTGGQGQAVCNKAFLDNGRTELELDGGVVNEMYAPGHTVTELYAPHKSDMTVRQVNTELVEAEGPSPIFELPCPEQRQRQM
jgi:hypothetical protein